MSTRKTNSSHAKPKAPPSGGLPRRWNRPGQEKLDVTPIELPIGYENPETLQEQIARFVTQELSAIAEDDGLETFEESEDFDEEHADILDLSPYEMIDIEDEEGYQNYQPEPEQAPQEGKEAAPDAPTEPPPAENSQTAPLDTPQPNS